MGTVQQLLGRNPGSLDPGCLESAIQISRFLHEMISYLDLLANILASACVTPTGT